VSWRALEAGAPELARLGAACLEAGLGLLGTVRADGSPRVSPVGTFFIDGELVVGIMARSAKARDLRRDPRYALQSPVALPDAGEPELKLAGRVEPSQADGGWWEGGRPGADVYRLLVDEAVHVEWDVAAERVRVRRWTAERGESIVERAYP
jgi:Pyridoxamine 5'-phosphate oxidase